MVGTTEIEGQLLEFWEERDRVPTVLVDYHNVQSPRLHGGKYKSGTHILFPICRGWRDVEHGDFRPAQLRDMPLRLCHACMTQYIKSLLAKRVRDLVKEQSS